MTTTKYTNITALETVLGFELDEELRSKLTEMLTREQKKSAKSSERSAKKTAENRSANRSLGENVLAVMADNTKYQSAELVKMFGEQLGITTVTKMTVILTQLFNDGLVNRSNEFTKTYVYSKK